MFWRQSFLNVFNRYTVIDVYYLLVTPEFYT